MLWEKYISHLFVKKVKYYYINNSTRREKGSSGFPKFFCYFFHNYLEPTPLEEYTVKSFWKNNSFLLSKDYICVCIYMYIHI